MIVPAKQPEANTRAHWDAIYSRKSPETVSWYQPHARRSLQLIHKTGIGKDAAIIDVGGGASTLVDDLLQEGFNNVTVLDLSSAALSAAKSRLGDRARRVKWIEADVTRFALPADAYDVWHDRAVFHFLTDEADRDAYVRAVLRSVKPGGHVIVATFGEHGPTRCSGLPVVRYRPDELHAQFGDDFTLIDNRGENHRTPWGDVQQFVYCYCRKQATPAEATQQSQ